MRQVFQKTSVFNLLLDALFCDTRPLFPSEAAMADDAEMSRFSLDIQDAEFKALVSSLSSSIGAHYDNGRWSAFLAAGEKGSVAVNDYAIDQARAYAYDNVSDVSDNADDYAYSYDYYDDYDPCGGDY